MHVILLILGALIAAAGIVLLAAGVPLQGHDFDVASITPGAVAIIGGLVLIGLGLAVRVLARIEQALAARPPAPPSQAADAAITAALSQSPAAPTAVAAPGPQPAVQSAAPPTPAEETEVAPAREKFPSLVRLDEARAAESAEVSQLPQPPLRADQSVGEAHQVVAPRHAVGAAPPRTVARFGRSVRPANRPDRSKSFDSFWPQRQRPGQDGQIGAAASEPAAPAEPIMPVAPEPSREAAPDLPPPAAVAEAPMPVSILKSGVVDGMAYTLYSDGSIEAQLPQGTLRFGSITELRNHIEQGA